jgi:hypothetical protein
MNSTPTPETLHTNPQEPDFASYATDEAGIVADDYSDFSDAPVFQIALTLTGHSPDLAPCKTCATCREQKALGQFYADRTRRDGLTRECRTCDAARHRKRWRANPERLQAKARHRYQSNLAENRKRSAARRRSPRGKAINLLAVKRYGSRNADKRAAHAAVSKALRAGLLIRPAICDMAEHGDCQGRIEAHHPDHAKPLDVQWLCTRHHHELRRKPAVYHPPAPLLEIGAP